MSATEYVHITPEENELSSIKTNILCEIEGCGRTFKSVSVLKFHQSQFHQCKRIQRSKKKDFYVEERFHCPVKDCIYYYSACTVSRYFEQLRYLKQHYLKVHSDCSFPCNQCNKSFSTKSYLRAHQMHCDLDVVCSCGQKFSSITSIQTHVKRKGHSAQVLEIYARRMSEKKTKKIEEVPKLHSSSQERFLLPKSATPTNYASPIISVPQQGHLNAAIALSELAFAGLKRISTVEVGVQTEPTPSRRLSRKSSSPIRSREPQSKKRKQTTEMETQTQLTNLKGKPRKRGTKRVAKCSIATDTNVPRNTESALRETVPKVFKCDIGLECNYNLFNESEHPCSSLDGQMYKTVNNKNDLSQHLNTSSTQTNSALKYEVFVPSHDESCLPYGFFRGDKETLDQSQGSEEEAQAKEEYSEINENDINNQFESSQILIDDEDSLVGLNSSGELSSLISHRAPSLSSQNRSSSIETQTEHDVFLSTHVQTPDDADDIILTSSETQTFEDFSEIEPFLCSFNVTQTVGEHHSSSELFPELNSFTSDMQTQTSTDETSNEHPNCVTTHTQTTIFGFSGS